MDDAADIPALNFPDLPPFPDDVPTCPLLRLSLQKLLDDDQNECNRLWTACTELGFFYLDCRGTSSSGQFRGDSFIDNAYKMFDISSKFFDLPLEEKRQYDFSPQGSYFGYKGYGDGYIDKTGTRDSNEFYNLSKDDILGLADRLPAPAVLDQFRPDVAAYMRGSHSIVSVILDRLNDKLHLPNGRLSSLHRLEAKSGDQVRFVRSPPKPGEDLTAALGAHTDFGSVSVLFNRLGGLQVLPPGGSMDQASDWLYVRPLPGHCVVNLGDAMVKFTRGILRSNMHRVVNPPGTQSQSIRTSLVYFSRPEDDVMLKPLLDSDLVQAREPAKGEDEAVSSKDWVLRRALGRRGGMRVQASDSVWNESPSTVKA